MSGGPFVEGESCLLLDTRGKQYLLTLDPSLTFQCDMGQIRHGDIVGTSEGSMIRTSKASPMVALRPRLADYVLKMKRGAAVVYPKDAAAIIHWADVEPGSTVLEAGTGSGALTLALSRAVGDRGRVVTCDVRGDHQTHAKRLIERFRGAVPANIEFRVGDVTDHIAEVAPDHLILDLPEPWHAATVGADFIKGGGSLAAYVPTIPQVEQLRSAVSATKAFVEVDTFEVLMRSWNVDGASVRPDHRMVGHTGFITVARRRVKEVRDELGDAG